MALACRATAERMLVENTEREWRGSPLDVQGTIDFHGIEEIVLEFDNGGSDVFRSRQRQEFHSYELSQMSAYLDALIHSIRVGQIR